MRRTRLPVGTLAVVALAVAGVGVPVVLLSGIRSTGPSPRSAPPAHPRPSPSPGYLPSGEAWAPAVRPEGDRLVMPVTFPEGTTAELVYPPELALHRLNVSPDTYADGGPRACGWGVHATRHDPAAGWIRGSAPLFEHTRADGGVVALWDGGPAHEPHDFLVYRFGAWSILVPCRFGGPGDEEALASWAEHLHGRQTPEGLLVLWSDPPLVVNPWRDQHGPTIRMSNREVVLDLRPGSEQCDPGSGWGGDTDPGDGVVQWCVQPEGAVYLYANGFTPEARRMLGLLVEGLEVRDVRPSEAGQPTSARTSSGTSKFA